MGDVVMAIIPLKQTATVRKFLTDNDNGWSVDDYGEPIEYKVRATEKFEVVTNQLGEEITASVKLTFDKFPDISYNDLVAYENENGERIERKPIAIKPIRMVNGKPALTGVWL